MKHTFFLSAICWLIFVSPHSFPQKKSIVAQRGAVVSVDEFASKIGVSILKKGGNAVDAAVATAFALAVTYPQAGNIGGGGFMMIRTKNGEAVAIDYREKAPMKAHARMFLRPDGTLDTMLSDYGYLVAGIPGTVRGLETAWKKYGKSPWRELVMPAVELAENGFVLNPVFAAYLESNRSNLSRYDETRKIFFKEDGQAYRAGELLVQKDLARTLRAIADHGADAFYEGPLADAMAEEIARNGGIWTIEDLRNYGAVVRTPVRSTYRGLEIISMPPPSSGGIAVIEMLNILENFELKPGHAETYHLIAESMRLTFFDRARFLGDPDFVKVPVDRLISKSYAKDLSKVIDIRKTRSSEELASEDYPEISETTHFSVIDAEGNIVSNTYTLEDWFGSCAVVKGLGFLLNNEMHDFNIEPDVYGFTGQKEHNKNLIEPGKRMLSSMTPTIVLKNGKPFLVTGSPGGKTIINTVAQIIVAMTDYHLSLRGSVDQPRLSQTWKPDRILIERGRWHPEVISQLRAKGHKIEETEFIGDAHSIWIDPKSGLIYGEADTRRYGWAEGY